MRGSTYNGLTDLIDPKFIFMWLPHFRLVALSLTRKELGLWGKSWPRQRRRV